MLLERAEIGVMATQRRFVFAQCISKEGVQPEGVPER